MDYLDKIVIKKEMHVRVYCQENNNCENYRL